MYELLELKLDLEVPPPTPPVATPNLLLFCLLKL
jgi:hypothetical protein